jgi:hypothetical protein
MLQKKKSNVTSGCRLRKRSVTPTNRCAQHRFLFLAWLYYNDKPYLAAYGTVESAWSAIAEAVASEPVFNPPPGGAAIHKRFDNLMEFVKKHGGKVPHRTGEDDEEPLLNYSSFWSAVMRKKPHMN